MRIRIKATGQVEDFDAGFARRAIESGMAEEVNKDSSAVREKSGMPESAAVIPAQNASIGAPRFTRIR